MEIFFVSYNKIKGNNFFITIIENLCDHIKMKAELKWNISYVRSKGGIQGLKTLRSACHN